MDKMARITLEKLVFGGQALGRHQGKVLLIWGGLPGEEVTVAIGKRKRNYWEGVVTEIHSPAPERHTPTEAHHLSCSPWDIMTYEAEQTWKESIVQESWAQGKITPPDDYLYFQDEHITGYRNKIEYSFHEHEDHTISLAFHERGQKRRVALDACQLAQPWINEVAQAIINWVRLEQIPYRSLKSVIIRGNQAGQTIAAIFIKDRLTFKTQPQLPTHCLGWTIYYSTHKSPAAVPTDILYKQGQNYITETVRNTTLKYGILSFFQVNIPLFEKTLHDIHSVSQQTIDTSHAQLVDMYCGVGSIGLPMHNDFASSILIDSNQEAIAFANDNIATNHAQHTTAYCSEAEKIISLIPNQGTVIVDPPRAGLHPKVVKRLFDQAPPRILYLSCNITTQVRDVALLQSKYICKKLRVYNYFPRTPHIESLIVLERK